MEELGGIGPVEDPLPPCEGKVIAAEKIRQFVQRLRASYFLNDNQAPMLINGHQWPPMVTNGRQWPPMAANGCNGSRGLLTVGA